MNQLNPEPDLTVTGRPAAPNGTGRDTRGRFTPGHTAAVRHGFDANNLPPELAAMQSQISSFEAGALIDEAEGEDLPTRRRSLIEYRARLHRRIVQLDAALELHGLFDRRGKLRAAWLQRLESLMNSAKSIDAALGLERRAKRVPSLAEVLNGD